MVATKSSGVFSASQQIVTGMGYLMGMQVITDGTNPGTLKIYDGTSSADKQVAEFSVVGTSLVGGRIFQLLACPNGIYAALSGTGAKAIVDYIDKA